MSAAPPAAPERAEETATYLSMHSVQSELRPIQAAAVCRADRAGERLCAEEVAEGLAEALNALDFVLREC